MGLIDNYKWQWISEVKRIVDGDTMDLMLDKGHNDFKKMRVRIVDIDTPETWRPTTEAERKHGEEATKRANELMPVLTCESCGCVTGTKVLLETFKTRASIYGRYDGKITLDDGRVYAVIMIEEGFEKRDDYPSDEEEGK